MSLVKWSRIKTTFSRFPMCFIFQTRAYHSFLNATQRRQLEKRKRIFRSNVQQICLFRPQRSPQTKISSAGEQQCALKWKANSCFCNGTMTALCFRFHACRSNTAERTHIRFASLNFYNLT